MPEPAFWFGFEVSWAKLATARVVIFVLLAIDALLQIRHAPRYGANDFNVAQLPGLDGLGAGRVGYEVAQLVEAYLFVLAACNVATRRVVPLAAAIYAWLYFGSQLDSYQHHYLVAILLGLASFVPWQRPKDATPATRVRSWALRLVLVELAIMYAWAAISKMDGQWVDGSTLALQLGGSLRSLVDATVGIKLASVMVIVVELVLAATIWRPQTWIVAAPLGIAFHAGILASGLEIGLFAVLMLGFYVLVVPDRVFVALGDGGRDLRELLARMRAPIAWGIAVVATIVVAWLVRFEHGRTMAIVACMVPVGFALAGKGPKPALAHAAALVVWLVVDRASDVATDYYKYWGGAQRRLGDTVQAEQAYRSWIGIAPDDPAPHFQLARILLAAKRTQEGLDELHATQRLAPTSARAFLEEARYLANTGNRAGALDKAKAGLTAEPTSADARKLVRDLGEGKRAGKPQPARDDD